MSTGHPIAAVELHGATPNKTYHVSSGELSCAYSQGDIKTDTNGDFKGEIDLFGSCEGNLYFYDDTARQFVTGFVVK